MPHDHHLGMCENSNLWPILKLKRSIFLQSTVLKPSCHTAGNCETTRIIGRSTCRPDQSSKVHSHSAHTAIFRTRPNAQQGRKAERCESFLVSASGDDAQYSPPCAMPAYTLGQDEGASKTM